MQKIVPHLWFDKEAHAAAEFYASVFPDSKVTNVKTLSNMPSGDCDVVSFEIFGGYEFMAISAGPFFHINPSISFMINFDPSDDKNAETLLNSIWAKLAPGGKVLMPLDAYPFSKRYGWIEDKYGVSWQLILTNPAGEKRPRIIPSLMFTGDVCGIAKEATDFYLSLFKNAKRGLIASYPAGMDPDKEGSTMFTDFQLENQWFAATDSAREHKITFNEAVSLVVNCETQEEIDAFWNTLSAVPQSEQCGWLKDKYGVSWQIIPIEFNEMMSSGTPEQIARLTQAFLKMKKFDIEALRRVY